MDPKTAYPSSYPFSTIYLVHLRNRQDNKYNTYDLIHTKSTIAQRSQIGTHDGIRIRNHILCLTFHHGRRARLTWAWGAAGAFCGRWALDLRATWARAGWAIATWLLALRTVQNDRILLGDRRLENIITEIRNGWALALQNIIAHVRYRRARWDRRLENIIAHIRLFALRARRTNGTGTGFLATAWVCHSTCIAHRSSILKSFIWIEL